MTIRVETGVNVASANAYVTVAEFVTFHTDRGNTTIAEADADQIESAIIKGTDYLEQKFRLLWKGSRTYSTQVLSWPRRGVDVPDFFDPFFRDLSNIPISFQDTLFIAENEVPYEVKVANFLIAAETFDGALSTGVLQLPLGGRLTQKEKLGVLEVVYFPQTEVGEASQKNSYWNVNQTIEPFLNLTRLHGGQLLRN